MIYHFDLDDGKFSTIYNQTSLISIQSQKHIFEMFCEDEFKKTSLSSIK